MKIWGGLILIFLFISQPAFALHFVALGDSRTNPGTFQSIIDLVSKANPELIVNTGDLWDGYGVPQYKSILTKNSNIKKLLDSNLYLVSRGNHEASGEFLAFQPSLVRGGKEVYSYTVGNSFFVSLSMDPSLEVTYLEQQLQSPAANAATWKFVYSHFPVYSVGDHGSNGIPALEKLCDKYGVTMFINGHDHIYNRSHQMYAGKVVDSSNALKSKTGTVYLVTGGAGAPLYAVHAATWSHFSKSINHYTDIVADADKVTVKAISITGLELDAFTISQGTTSVAATNSLTQKSLDVTWVQSQKIAILSFPPIEGSEGVLEINSPTGIKLHTEILKPGQRTFAWNYGASPKGEYFAVLKDGKTSVIQKLVVSN